MAYEGPYAGLVELPQSLDEAQLGPEAPVCPVVDVAGNQQGIHLLLDTEVDDVLVGVEGGAAQGICDVGGGLVPDSPEGAIQVEIGGMDEAESGHGHQVLRTDIPRLGKLKLSWLIGFYPCLTKNARSS